MWMNLLVGMSNTTFNTTTGPLCPSLPIQVTSLPYTPNATAQTVTLITCIINGITCPVATVENLLVFVLVLRKRSLRTTYNTSVLCLAFTDLLIAMFIQPSFIAYQTGKYVSSTYACVPYFIKTVFEFWCVGLTFVTLALITVMRYFAVFKPFQYRIHVTPLRAMFGIFSGWLLWTMFSFSLRFSSSGMNLKAYSILCSILITFTLIETIFVSVKLYFEIKQRTAKRTSDQEHSSAIKATRTILIITGAFLICFFPILCASIVHHAGVAENEVVFHIIYPLAECALFLTALINPIIFVWRNVSIRSSLKEFTKLMSN
ncbi:histamine H2 receptor-like [Oculina patagonica]